MNPHDPCWTKRIERARKQVDNRKDDVNNDMCHAWQCELNIEIFLSSLPTELKKHKLVQKHLTN